MNSDPRRPKPQQTTRGGPISFNFIMLMVLFVGSGVLAYGGAMPNSPLIFVFVFAGWFVALCLHEFGHAIAAYRGGDYTVADKGYLTLDFLNYTHPMYSLILPALVLAMGNFAFPGGAVFVRTDLLRSRMWDSIVSAAGPAANMLFLFVLLIPFWLGLPERGGSSEFWGGAALLAFLNIGSMLFNLLPIPGIDGYGIIRPWLPHNIRIEADRFAPFALMGLVLLIFAVPGAARWFFEPMFRLSMLLGLDFAWVASGIESFFFWR